MVKIILAVFCISTLLTVELHAQNNKLFDDVLNDNVSNGFVDYSKLKDDKRLNKYFAWFADVNPDTIKNTNDKLAFWINAYNAFTLKVVCDNYPIESINDLHSGGFVIAHILGTTIWHKELFIVNHKNISLNNIEHDIIREKFSEPRIHFALVCASVSCPALRSEAYSGKKLDEQLNDQTRIFINDSTKNYFNINSRSAFISKIFDWYDEDFGGSENRVLQFISNYLDKNLSEDMHSNLEKWDVEYNSYNWDLNDILNRRQLQ